MARVGLSRTTGRMLVGWEHCIQSIGDIATTIIGERVEVRDYGLGGPGLQDGPGNEPTIVLHFAALADALRRWEPGYRMRRWGVTRLGRDGIAGFTLTGDFYPNGHLGDYSIVETGRSLAIALARAGRLA